MLPLLLTHINYSLTSHTTHTTHSLSHTHTHTHTHKLKTQVKEWLCKNGLDRFVVTYGEKSLTKFDIYVEIDWNQSAFRKRIAGKTSFKEEGKKKSTIIGNLEIECPVCYEKRPGATLIPCGHIFCWDCCTHANLKQCPICKASPLFAQRLFLP